MNQSESNATNTPTSPTPETSPQTITSSTSSNARSDPRRRNSNSSMSRPADPRQSRTGIGAATSTCPPTPRTDDYDEPTMVDTDLRMQAVYGRRQSQWENVPSRGRGLLPHPDLTSYGSRLPQAQPNPYHQQRSYTPPPT